VGTMLKKIMGSSPKVKVIEYLLNWDSYDLTISDISRETKASRNNVAPIMEEFERLGIVNKSERKTQGMGKYFIINKKSKIIKKIRELVKCGGNE